MNNELEKSIVIADDHEMFRQGLRSLLKDEQYTIVGEASNGHEAIKKVRQYSPLVAILDYSMPMLNGIETALEIQKVSPRTHVILLTMYEEEVFAMEALRAGIRGYVLKSQAAIDLVNAIREVLLGSLYLSPRISESVLKALLSNKERADDLLTNRERQVLQLIAEGNTTKDIANLLHLSVKTAESHRSNIMQRLDIHNVANLVRYAIRRGLIQA